MSARTKATDEDRTIFVVAEGLTAFSYVRNKGERIIITPEMYEQTQDTDGNSWLDLDADAQVAQFGKVMFTTDPAKAPTAVAGEPVERSAQRVPPHDDGALEALKAEWERESRASKKRTTRSRTTSAKR